jgi:hypothetical protein
MPRPAESIRNLSGRSGLRFHSWIVRSEGSEASPKDAGWSTEASGPFASRTVEHACRLARVIEAAATTQPPAADVLASNEQQVVNAAPRRREGHRGRHAESVESRAREVAIVRKRTRFGLPQGRPRPQHRDARG